MYKMHKNLRIFPSQVGHTLLLCKLKSYSIQVILLEYNYPLNMRTISETF